MRILIALVLIAGGFQAFAKSPLKAGAQHFFENGDRNFLSHSALGPVCSSMRTIRSEPACNPALLGEDASDDERASRLLPMGVFGANLFFGDDYETLYKNKDLISDNDKMKLAQSLMSETKPIRFESSVLMWWRSEKMAVSYQPMRWTYFSDVRNQSYPDIAIHGMQEQSMQAQVGGFLDENWRAGVQVRFVDRKFVHEEFNLFQAMPTLQDHFQVRTQRAFFIEPGIAYELNQTEELERWRPLLALNVSQTGWLDRNYDDVPVKPIFDAGFSLSPPVSYGEVEVGLNYRWTSYVSEERKFRLGALYRLALAEFYAGYDPDEWSMGFSSTFRAFSAGLMYKRTQLDDDSQERFEDSTFVEFRLVL
jgi:hypothetical protein